MQISLGCTGVYLASLLDTANQTRVEPQSIYKRSLALLMQPIKHMVYDLEHKSTYNKNIQDRYI